MNDPNELNELLGDPPTIEIDQKTQQQSREVALSAFRESQTHKSLHRQRNLLIAAVLVLTGFTAGILVQSMVSTNKQEVTYVLPSSDAIEILANGKQLFGNQIEAVVVNQKDVKWFLSKGTPSTTAEPYYLIHFVDPVTQQPVSVISTTGGQFSIDNHRAFELLKNANGQYTVTGGDAVIDSDSLTVKPLTL